MLNEVGAPTEGLVTLGIMTGFLIGVDLSVLDEGCILRKTLFTGPSLVELISLVNPLMLSGWNFG